MPANGSAQRLPQTSDSQMPAIAAGSDPHGRAVAKVSRRQRLAMARDRDKDRQGSTVAEASHRRLLQESDHRSAPTAQILLQSCTHQGLGKSTRPLKPRTVARREPSPVGQRQAKASDRQAPTIARVAPKGQCWQAPPRALGSSARARSLKSNFSIRASRAKGAAQLERSVLSAAARRRKR